MAVCAARSIRFARLGRAHPLTAPFCRPKGKATVLGSRDSTTVFEGPLRLSGEVTIEGMVLVVGDLELDGLLVMGTLRAEVLHWSYSAINEGLLFVSGVCEAALTIKSSQGGGDDELIIERTRQLRAVLEPDCDGPLDGETVASLVGAGTHQVRKGAPLELEF